MGGKLVLPPSTFQSGEGDCPQLLFPLSGISEVRTADSYGAFEFMLVRSFSDICVAQSSVFCVFVILCQPLNICLFVLLYLYITLYVFMFPICLCQRSRSLFSYMDRVGTCIFLDKKYNIANSSCRFGPVRHQKNIILTSEASVHIQFVW